MSVTPAGLLALDAHNDSIGTPFNHVSPYVIDALTIVLILVCYRYTSAYGVNGLVIAGYLIAALLAGFGALRSSAIRRFIIDTPKSRINSASQGFVVLQGRCDFYGNRQSQGFMSGPPCVWHRYSVLKRSGFPVQTGSSTIPFIVSDETGVCVVDPAGAKILSSSTRSWIENGKRYSSRYIRPGAQTYILGELQTHGGANATYHKGTQVSGLLARWKKDAGWLLEEFDADGNGKIDMHEWESVRARAEVVAKNIFDEKATFDTTHTISKPRNGMPYIISDRDPAPLATRFGILACANWLGAITCFVWACWLVAR